MSCLQFVFGGGDCAVVTRRAAQQARPRGRRRASTMWSATPAASSMSRVKSTTVTPSSWAMARRSEQQVRALLGLEVAGRLVGQQDGRAADQRAGERGALALGGGQLRRAARRAARARPTRSSRASTASGSCGRRAISSGSATFSRTVMVGRTEAAGRRRPIRSRRRRVSSTSSRPRSGRPSSVDGAGGGAVEPGQEVEERGLARAGRTDHGRDLAGGRLERYVAEHVDARAEIADAVEEIVRDDSRHGQNCPRTGPRRKGRLAAPLR